MPRILSQEEQINILFEHLEHRPGALSFPGHGHVSAQLEKLVEKAEKSNVDVLIVGPSISSLYASAAVEMWLRGVHSFLVSSSLTGVSHVWASVSGYYASHYCIRGLAHLLGYFQLFKRKRIVRISIEGGKHYCHIGDKGGKDREHKYYWRIVKNTTPFKDNDFFTLNEEDSGTESDSGHRNIANYSDHLGSFPNFHPLDQAELVERIDHLSKVELSSVPIPRKEKYPDLINVQLVAYHRLITFRKYLDEIVPSRNVFWRQYRNPNWCSDYLNFQVVEPSFITSYKGTV